jgi:hypothetical protein
LLAERYSETGLREMMRELTKTENKWAWVVAFCFVVITTPIVMYYDIEFRYVVLAIGIIGGSAILGACIITGAAMIGAGLLKRRHSAEIERLRAENDKLVLLLDSSYCETCAERDGIFNHLGE